MTGRMSDWKNEQMGGWKDGRLNSRKTSAFKAAALEQQKILGKRMRIFARATLAEAFLVLAVGAVPFLIADSSYMMRAIARIYLGQSCINGLFAISLLLLYAGIRKQNLLSGLCAVLMGALAMMYSPLLRVTYAQFALFPENADGIRIPVCIFLLVYLLPLSIMVFQLPSFFRWNKLREMYEDRLDDRTDGRIEGGFEAAGWKPGPVMLLWLVLLLAGTGICVKDVKDYTAALDTSSWERYTMPGTEVSMNLPVDNREETGDGEMYMVHVAGERFTVAFYCDDTGDLADAQDGPETEEAGEPLSEPRTGLMGGTEYRQTAVRQERVGTTFDSYTRTFELQGIRYGCSVTVPGRTDRKMEETAERIFDSIRIGAAPRTASGTER